jgi:TfoX/Sxy family transcriptional regulator of competence genes
VAFDSMLADRIRFRLGRRKHFTERKMFGGICFLLKGNMCCGVIGTELIIRVKPEQAESILKEKHTRVFDFSGRPSRSLVFVGPKALQKEADLSRWLQLTVKFATALPPKT